MTLLPGTTLADTPSQGYKNGCESVFFVDLKGFSGDNNIV
jgi:hypothetical protein